MDPKVKLALEAIALGLKGTDPLAYGNIVAFMAGREALKADTLMKVLPLLQRAGITAADLPAFRNPTPGTTGNTAADTTAINDPIRGGQSSIGRVPFSVPETGGRATMGRNVAESAPAHPTSLTPGQAFQNAAKNALPPSAGSQGAESMPTITPPGVGPQGNFTAAQGALLGEDDNQLVRFALQSAGLNPDRMGKFGQIVARMLAPLVAARRNAFGIAGGDNVGGLPQDIASFAKEFTTPGVNAFGHAADYARQTDRKSVV